MRRLALLGSILLATASTAHAATIDTNDPLLAAAFAGAGATVQTFETVSGLTPLPLSAYTNAANSTTEVPLSAQLGGQIPGLHFHSGGATPSNPAANPGTPTALLALQAGIAGDAHSASNVVGSLEINSTLLDIDAFIEIIFTSAFQDRVGFWLNPSLGPVLFTAFDAAGGSLESVNGTAGNFVGIDRPTSDIRHVSIISLAAGTGFTIDDLTYAGAAVTPAVAEPGSLALLVTGLLTGAGFITRRRRHSAS